MDDSKLMLLCSTFVSMHYPTWKRDNIDEQGLLVQDEDNDNDNNNQSSCCRCRPLPGCSTQRLYRVKQLVLQFQTDVLEQRMAAGT